MYRIITVEKGDTDIIYGGGIYDGRFNVDPVLNSNFIDRAFMLAALHRKPKKMLDIGLSSGSWAKVMSDYAPIQDISVVEINPGYADLIKKYPDIAGVLQSPKVTIFFDDGRRWLRNHPDGKFDVILMNTSYYWRSNSTNLLSREFLQLAKRHLNQNGVIYYNTTDSNDVVLTAAHVFQHVTKFRNFVAASDAPFDMSAAEKRANLLLFKQADGTPLFTKNEQYEKKMNDLAEYQFPATDITIKQDKTLQVITDDNMAVEYKVPNTHK